MQNDISVFSVGVRQKEFGPFTLNALCLPLSWSASKPLKSIYSPILEKKNKKTCRKRQGIVENQFGHELAGSAP